MDKSQRQKKSRSQLVNELEDLRRRLLEVEAVEAEHRQIVETLRESEKKYRILLDDSSDPIFTFSADGQYRYVNRAFADGVGREAEQIIGKKIWDVFSQDEADKRFAVVKWVFENGETKVIEVRVPRTDGNRYYITTIKPVMNDQDEVATVICISKEITDRKRMEQELRYLSTHDLLTGIYNRNFFEKELVHIQFSQSFPVSIMVSDLDDLKAVNDRYGHAAGDDLIREAARELRKSFRAEDIIARIGGDEFAVLLPRVDEGTAQAAVARLRKNLASRRDALLRLSIGLATGEEGSSVHEVMRLADDRMYQEKATHKKELN